VHAVHEARPEPGNRLPEPHEVTHATDSLSF
jgi:hypothetical protein